MNKESDQRGRAEGVDSSALPNSGVGSTRTLQVLLAAAILAALVAPLAMAGATSGRASQATRLAPVDIVANTAGAALSAQNSYAGGRAGRFRCAASQRACVYVRNTAGGPAAKFVGVDGQPPFEVGSAVVIPNLNADLLDGRSASQIVDQAAAVAAGSVTPAGPAGGDLTGTYPNPDLAADSIDSASLFVPGLRDGAAAAPTLRSLGTGAGQAAAGNDPRLSDARTPTGPAGGDLTGTYPNPDLAAGSVDSASLFTTNLLDGAGAAPTLRSLGTGANEAAAGNDPRLSDARTPTGPAGGDLTGTYPNPDLAAGSVGTGNLAALPGTRVVQTGTPQTFFNASLDVVRLDAASYGSGVTFNDANDQLVIQTAGTYLLTAEAQWSPVAGPGDRFLAINRNGSEELVADMRPAATTAPTTQTTSTPAVFGVGDTISLIAGQTSGAPLAMSPDSASGAGGRSAALTATWVGP